MDIVNITIIGAGVVGLAIACELSKSFTDIVVIDKNTTYGLGTSSRNSEVIHSGIYYPKESLKARLCVEGGELLYEFCRQNSIPHKKVGKLIVAIDESEIGSLEIIYRQGIENGVKDLKIIDKKTIYKLEPLVKALFALYSPNTGILNVHSLMNSLYSIAKAQGVIFSFCDEVDFIEKTSNHYLVGLKDEDYRFLTKIVINSGGLFADCIANLVGLDIDKLNYRLILCKGSYFYYTKPSPVNCLVYPLPNKHLKGLGVHATVDLLGRLRFGPDTEYVEKIDYQVSPVKRDYFYESANRIISGLEREYFLPDFSGIRPQLKGDGFKDFLIKHEIDEGLPGFINLIGIESPGLTASLAIGRMINNMVSHILR
ncbi:MAG: NAD(P)/FAD-dependent oxidoreductase [Thermodesulfovibrionales bacterium]|nr:NAD(P)/FAD-dependent oxidoreductase [Thermodesulfovibrionales bacterium]